MVKNQIRHGHGTHSPQSYDGNLKRYGSTPFTIGNTTSVSENEPNSHLKEILKVMLWNRVLLRMK